jgi:putative transcriptional regulator
MQFPCTNSIYLEYKKSIKAGAIMIHDRSLANHFLIAMPMLNDPIFSRSVIFICENHVQGTVGLMINRPMPFSLGLVFDQMQIDPISVAAKNVPLLFGGPIQPERGFVIHRPFGGWKSSLALREGVTVTTSNDIIRAMAQDKGPMDALIALGYAAWTEMQLDQEVMNNAWLVCPFKAELLYEVPFEKRWEEAGLTIGVKMNQLMSGSGHA